MNIYLFLLLMIVSLTGIVYLIRNEFRISDDFWMLGMLVGVFTTIIVLIIALTQPDKCRSLTYQCPAIINVVKGKEVIAVTADKHIITSYDPTLCKTPVEDIVIQVEEWKNCFGSSCDNSVRFSLTTTDKMRAEK